MNKFIFSPIFALILGLANNLIVPFVGEVTGSFILIVLTMPFWLSQIDQNDKIVKWALKLFLCLLLVQFITELFHDRNMILDKIKGIAVTITGIVHFFFFYTIYSKDIKTIQWYVLGLILSPYLFPSEFQQNLDSGYSEENVTYFKFFVVPAITNCLMLLTLFIKKQHWHKIIALAMTYLGALFIIMGARSGGLTLFIAGGIYIYISNNKIRIPQLKKRLLTIFTCILLLYECVYVPMVMTGNIKAGNTEQLLKSSNPYNPIEILKMGRTDSLVPFYAFMDSPLVGWGYWATDVGHKYAKMLFNMSGGDDKHYEKIINHYKRIPGHSVLFYFACAFGVGALICVFLLWYKSAKYTFYSLMCNDRYQLYRIFCLMNITWHLLFSPLPHFKYLPAYMAFLIISSRSALRIKKRINIENSYNRIINNRVISKSS
ncbi:hypothetical protein PL586_19310 [Phocaeicola vulgatus]|nr:hypothetical protein [Phocaeicola vulgatus]